MDTHIYIYMYTYVYTCAHDDISRRTFHQWVGASLKLIQNHWNRTSWWYNPSLDSLHSDYQTYQWTITHVEMNLPSYTPQFYRFLKGIHFFKGIAQCHVWHHRVSPEKRKLWRWRTTTSAPPRWLWAMDLLTTPRCPDAPCRDLVLGCSMVEHGGMVGGAPVFGCRGLKWISIYPFRYIHTYIYIHFFIYLYKDMYLHIYIYIY